ncbi:MAG: ribosome small subunit-dependent GTPase A [Bacilli bacterium]
MNEELCRYGYDEIIDFYVQECNLDGELGRVVKVVKGLFKVQTANSKVDCIILNKMYMYDDIPTIGDWVLINENIIVKILPRKNKLERKVVDRRVTNQVIAANIDSAVVFMPSDNVNEKLLYSILTFTKNFPTILIFTKNDLNDINTKYWQNKFPDIDIMSLSSITGANINKFQLLLTNYKTSIFIGQSGAGKSTLLNTLIGEEVMKTKEVNSKSNLGKHTTTHSELFNIGEFNIIDIPGMRTFINWVENDESTFFNEIIKLSKKCKYRDCTHKDEDGCYVKNNVSELLLKEYHKYIDTQMYFNSKVNKSEKIKYSKKMKKIYKRR